MSKRTFSTIIQPLQLRLERPRLPSSISFRCSWLHYHLCAVVFFISKHTVRARSFIERERMADDKRWIDIASTNSLKQRPHVFMYVRLPHLQCQTLRERRADRELVDHAAVCARDRNSAAFAA